MSSDQCLLSSQRSWTSVKKTTLQLVTLLCKGSLPITHSWLDVWLQGRTQWNFISKEVQKYRLHITHSEWKMQMFNGADIQLTWTTQDILQYIYKSNERALLWDTNSFKHSYLCTCHFKRHLWLLLWILNPENILSPSPGNSDLLH